MRLPSQLLRRELDTNKGDFGHILILAGSRRFSGAALLCAEAAIRSGAGLVTLGLPESLNLPIIRIKAKEIMLLPLPETKEGALSPRAFKKINDFVKKIDILVVGPGLGLDKTTQSLIRKVIIKTDKPIVIDADGLNALVGHLNILHKSSKEIIMTPHPGEMARLIGDKVDKVQNKKKEIAKKFCVGHKVTLVLKGYQTIVSDYMNNLYINKTGNPGMSTAGAGDVLTGIIAAFLGQGLSAFDAAKYGVYLHGLAGDLAAKEKTQISLIASDIIGKIPDAIKRCN